jgi:hypothetical protein
MYSKITIIPTIIHAITVIAIVNTLNTTQTSKNAVYIGFDFL